MTFCNHKVTSCYKWYWQKGASTKLEKTEILWLVAHDSWFGANMRNDAENPLHTLISLTKWHLFILLHVLVLFLIGSHQPQLEFKNNNNCYLCSQLSCSYILHLDATTAFESRCELYVLNMMVNGHMLPQFLYIGMLHMASNRGFTDLHQSISHLISLQLFCSSCLYLTLQGNITCMLIISHQFVQSFLKTFVSNVFSAMKNICISNVAH